jgi:hypothetical protein
MSYAAEEPMREQGKGREYGQPACGAEGHITSPIAPITFVIGTGEKPVATGRNPIKMLTMSDPHPSNQSRYCVLREHVADHAIGLALVQPTSGSACDDSACVLSPVLQQRQSLAYLRRGIDGRVV